MRKMNSLVWNGKRYPAGKEIPESVYEQFIDFAYGRGDDGDTMKNENDQYLRSDKM